MSFTGTYDVGYELTGRIVAMLRGDTELHGLLFSTRPSVDPQDARIYQANVELPEGAVREVLPRILVDATENPLATEQRDADLVSPQAGVSVFVHSFVEADQRQLGEQINARVRLVIGSTQASDSRIIAAELVPTGAMAPVREVAFRNAWRFTRSYRSPLVGVLP